ncbi:MAG: SH3 domain-containing protein [Kiritimatiellia bacterium]
MKRILTALLFAICASCHLQAADNAGERPAKGPVLKVNLSPAAKQYYAGQEVALSFTFDLADLNFVRLTDIRLTGLSEEQQENLSAFRYSQIPSSRKNLLQAQSTPFFFRKPGTYAFGLSVSGECLNANEMYLFYPRDQIKPFTMASTNSLVCIVLPVPVETRPACAVDAIGTYKISAGFVSTNCPPGGIATLLCTLQGPSTERIPPVFPAYDPGAGFRAYPPRLVRQDNRELTFQYDFILPSEGVFQPAPFSIATFNPLKGQWQEQTFSLPSVTVAPSQPEPPAVDNRPPPEETPPTPLEAVPAPATPPDAGSEAPKILASSPAPGCVSVRNEAVRIAPAAQAQVLFSIPAGTPLRVREAFGDWRRVLCPGNRNGWLPADAISAPNAL